MSAKIEFPDSNEFVKQLKQDLPNAVRFAAKFTLDRLAYSGVVKAERQIKRKMITRNKYTVGNRPGQKGIKYNKAKPRRDMSLIFSEFGATTDRKYLAKQEEGFKDKGSVPINTARASGKYNKVTRKKNYFGTMKVKSLKDFRGKGNSRRSLREFVTGYKGKTRRTRVMLYMAHKAGFGKKGSSDFFSIKNNQYHGFKKGLFQFANNSTKKGAYPNLRKMYQGRGVSNPTRYGKHWMRDALGQFKQQEIDAIFVQESKRQLKKHGLI